MQTFAVDVPRDSSQPIVRDNFEYIFGDNLTGANEGNLV